MQNHILTNNTFKTILHNVYYTSIIINWKWELIQLAVYLHFGLIELQQLKTILWVKLFLNTSRQWHIVVDQIYGRTWFLTLTNFVRQLVPSHCSKFDHVNRLRTYGNSNYWKLLLEQKECAIKVYNRSAVKKNNKLRKGKGVIQMELSRGHLLCNSDWD